MLMYKHDLVYLTEDASHDAAIEHINEEAFGPGRHTRAAARIREQGPHEEHDQAVGEEQQEGDEEEQGLGRPAFAADETGADDINASNVEWFQVRVFGQHVECRKAIFRTVEAGRVVKIGKGCGLGIRYQRTGIAGFRHQRALGRQHAGG